MAKGLNLDRISKATRSAFDRVGQATISSKVNPEVDLITYMKLKPEHFASLVSEFGMSAVEPYIREMEMKLARRGANGKEKRP